MKLCLLVLLNTIIILPVAGDSFFIDGKPGCKSSSYGLVFTNFTLTGDNCRNKLCKVGEDFSIKANLEVGNRLPKVVKVLPKICHANGYSCSNILSQRISRSLCSSLTPQDGQTCPKSGDYKMLTTINMPQEDGNDQAENQFRLKNFLGSGSSLFIMKAQLKPLKTTYEYQMAKEAWLAKHTDENGDYTEGDDATDDTAEEEEAAAAENEEVYYDDEYIEKMEQDENEPTESLFCHIPLHYTNNDDFDVDAYFQGKAAGRAYSRFQTQTEAASVGFVALLGLSVFGLRRRRQQQTSNENQEEENASQPGATTAFVVFGEQKSQQQKHSIV